jgi:hypothetical protein
LHCTRCKGSPFYVKSEPETRVSYAGKWVTANQAALCDAASVTSIPSRNVTPRITLGN